MALAVAAACPDAHHSTHGEASGRVPGARHAMACSPLGAGASIVAKFVGGDKAQEKFHVRNGRARAGADGVVLGACRGVAGGALRLGQGAGSTRIAQGRRVGRLQPKVHSLGVAGQFGDVVE